MQQLDHPLSIAPMIDWTYNHFRVFMRLLAPKALVYTEMQTVGAIKNNPKRALSYHEMEHPIALQLGGSDPQQLADCALIAEQQGYDEVNLNLGCPSDRVQAGQFGACLMAAPDLVAQCIKSMKSATSIPITAKTRIGIDHEDSYDFFYQFVSCLLDAGVDKLIVHARKAWLHGLNPKQNRTIPPVNYDFVYRVKQEFPFIPVIINGNISNITAIKEHLKYVDGVMLGRLACDNPYQIALIHKLIYPECKVLSRKELLLSYYDYLLCEFNSGVALSLLIKPIFNLAHGLPEAKLWKKHLMELIQTQNFKIFQDLIDYLSIRDVQEIS